MKKIIYLIVAAIVAINCHVSAKVTATQYDTVSRNGVYYRLAHIQTSYTDKCYAWVIKKPTGGLYSGAVSIASSVSEGGNTYPVDQIANEAFKGCTGLTSISIPSSVETIGSKAFLKCTGLTSISIPSSVTAIQTSAFRACTGLTSVTIPNTVSTIGSNAFDSCTNLRNVTLSNSITKLSSYCFRNCVRISSITIPTSVTELDSHCFENCVSLSSITIPNSVTLIEEYCFNKCTNLTSITLPNTVTYIGMAAFQDCTGLVSANIQGSSWIDSWGFSGCSALSSLSMPNVTTIGKYAFEGTNISSLYISSNVTSIKDYAFRNCRNLSSITVNSSNSKYDSRNNCNAVIEKSTNTLLFGCSSSTVPSTVVAIKENAFQGSGIASITIPNSVTNIGHSAFYGCKSLVSATLSNSIDTIKAYTFYNCEKLSSITIPNSVTAINWAAFCNCTALESVAISSSVRTISIDAFSNCKKLTSLTIPASVNSIEGRSAFSGCGNLSSISVNSGNTVYDSRNNCNALIETSSNILFLGCGNTIIPNTVEKIYSNAFLNCKNLYSINIPNSVTSIFEHAFKGCEELQFVVTPASLTEIEKGSFFDCKKLQTFYFQNPTVPDIDLLFSISVSDGASIGATYHDSISKPDDMVFYVPKNSLAAYQSALNKYGFPVLPIEYGDVVVTVNANDNTMGYTEGSGVYNILGLLGTPTGVTVKISATAEPGNEFKEWNDGITDNPRRVFLTSDTTFTAIFVSNATGIENSLKEEILVYANGKSITVQGAVYQPVYLYDTTGKLIAFEENASEETSFNVSLPGIYMVKIGDTQTIKVIVK